MGRTYGWLFEGGGAEELAPMGRSYSMPSFFSL